MVRQYTTCRSTGRRIDLWYRNWIHPWLSWEKKQVGTRQKKSNIRCCLPVDFSIERSWQLFLGIFWKLRWTTFNRVKPSKSGKVMVNHSKRSLHDSSTVSKTVSISSIIFIIYILGVTKFNFFFPALKKWEKSPTRTELGWWRWQQWWHQHSNIFRSNLTTSSD